MLILYNFYTKRALRLRLSFKYFIKMQNIKFSIHTRKFALEKIIVIDLMNLFIVKAFFTLLTFGLGTFLIKQHSFKLVPGCCDGASYTVVNVVVLVCLA